LDGQEIADLGSQDGYISKPTRTLLVQISEMGMLYRQVTTFIDSREAGISKGGMTEQVSRGVMKCAISDQAWT
jgi:gamma-tubulin complex component 3